MDNTIKGFIKFILNSVSGSAKANGITETLAGWSKDLYGFATTIQTNVMMPVGYMILALFALLELYRISEQVEAMGGGSDAGVRLISAALVKVAFCKIAMDSMNLFMNAIMQVSITLSQGIGKLVNSGHMGTIISVNDIYSPLVKEGFWTKLMIMVLLLFVMLITMLATVLVNVVVTGRFLQMYVFLAVSPIPIATMPHHEFSGIAKNFFKSFMAVSIQGTLIYMVQLFYPFLMKTAFANVDKSGVLPLIASLMGFSILLIFAVFQTNSWAKSLTTAM
ncbi:hypothetical protein [Lacticaseibacillus paracasei]|uniref:hypothetical protein n=1 Tax=Lacticaseibacillus paracasei TaxID=1597 RepID=UPI0021A8AD45|nr:hypothetical protein [Lacticaseibacillus paracasei]MCT4385459.1 hypothetical protein [Lacticaseibacillus paracasei]